MPRGHGVGRGSRLTRGQFSAVSIATYPSGTTITKDGVEQTKGFLIPLDGGLSTYKMVAGVSNCAGTKLTSVNFGLSTIIMCQVSCVTNQANVTAMYAVVSPHQAAAGQSWSGVTQVDVNLYASPSGTTLTSACSVSYFAIGT